MEVKMICEFDFDWETKQFIIRFLDGTVKEYGGKMPRNKYGGGWITEY